MPDAQFEVPALVALYDAVEGDRSDLLPHVALVGELGARSVVDAGCGTGVLALLLTGDVAQAITDPGQWAATLGAVRRVLVRGGTLALETRDPAARAWLRWTRSETERTLDVAGVGEVTAWVEVTSVAWPLVAFTTTFVFSGGGLVLTSKSRLRFREQDEVVADLARCGFEVQDVREAPDRPGLELVFVARPAEIARHGPSRSGSGFVRASGPQRVSERAAGAAARQLGHSRSARPRRVHTADSGYSDRMDTITGEVTTRELRSQLAEVLGRAAYGGQRIGVTRNGKLAAVVIGVEDLEALESFEMNQDVAAYRAAKDADDGSRVSLEDVRASLEHAGEPSGGWGGGSER